MPHPSLRQRPNSRTQLLRGIALVMVLGAPACGGGGPTTPQRGALEGHWEATATLVGVQGQDCAAAVFRAMIGDQEQIEIQAVESEGEAEATVRDESGFSCAYEGMLGGNRFELTADSCTLAATGVTCEGGQMRQIVFETSTATGTVGGDEITGRTRDLWSINDPATGADHGEMTLIFEFEGTRTP